MRGVRRCRKDASLKVLMRGSGRLKNRYDDTKSWRIRLFVLSILLRICPKSSSRETNAINTHTKRGPREMNVLVSPDYE